VGAAAAAEAPPVRRGVLRGLRRSGAPARPVRTLAVALTLSAALAGGLAFANQLVRSTPSASNTALADVGATADVATQLGSALETVYSYDFTRLDENERLARGVITPAFAAKFDQLFAQVRQLAPQQQAVVSATVTTSAVQSIEGDHAVLVAFLDQEATRANPGSEPQQVSAAGRLTVIGQRDGDTWKIADVLNR
jgi:Mce-associated membrane protein